MCCFFAPGLRAPGTVTYEHFCLGAWPWVAWPPGSWHSNTVTFFFFSPAWPWVTGNRQTLRVGETFCLCFNSASTRSKTLVLFFHFLVLFFISWCFFFISWCFFSFPGAFFCAPDCAFAGAFFVLLIVLLLVLFLCS